MSNRIIHTRFGPYYGVVAVVLFPCTQYTRYVNTNYDELVKEYDFLGSNEATVEPFEKAKKYDAVFVQKKLTL